MPATHSADRDGGVHEASRQVRRDRHHDGQGESVRERDAREVEDADALKITADAPMKTKPNVAMNSATAALPVLSTIPSLRCLKRR